VAFLNYEYKMKISYSEPVDKCYFTIKSIPAEDFRQKGITYEIGLVPPAKYSESQDSFGNTQIIGSEGAPHSVFEFQIKGLIETHAMNIAGGVSENTVGMYRYAHGKCIPGKSIRAFYEEIREDVLDCSTKTEQCKKIMNHLFQRMTYEKGSTGIDTTAEEAFQNGKGVCQDFAHVYICLLRLFGIPARYVCGLIVGEGASHAWVEAAFDGNYVAYDPTYNKEISEEYIKLGVGRDAVDCAINRGVMWGGGLQTQEISVKVEKRYE